MNWNELRRRARYYIQFFPLTRNSLWCGAAVWLAYWLLYRESTTGTAENLSQLRPFVLLMARMSFWFLLSLVALSLLSTLVCWAYYLWQKGRKQWRLELEFSTEQREDRPDRVWMQAVLPGVWRPLLGFVQARLFYDQYQLTDKFSLLGNRRKPRHTLRFAISGKSRLRLPDIKDYQLRGGFVYFEDMLQLFSLAVPQVLSGQFFQPPQRLREQAPEGEPRMTEIPEIRIEQMRRVEGEPFSYKDFEAGDDVRRIVWKVYAKNRELVVRLPEKFEPYASHLYFYASFHAALRPGQLETEFLKEMGNYYKNQVWTVYEALSRKAGKIRYIPDQRFAAAEAISDTEQVSRILSQSAWQQDRSLEDYFSVRRGAVLCISSLTDPAALARVLEAADQRTVVYFVKLSQTFRHLVALGWLRRMLFLPPEDRLSRLRGRWFFSPMRGRLRTAERELERQLAESEVKSIRL